MLTIWSLRETLSKLCPSIIAHKFVDKEITIFRFLLQTHEFNSMQLVLQPLTALKLQEIYIFLWDL
jgi:hypothetical protein